MKAQIVLFDQNTGFIKSLGTFLSEKYDYYFESFSFDNEEKFIQYVKDTEAALYFVEPDISEYVKALLLEKKARFFYFTKEKSEEGIYYYQSADRICRDIFTLYEKEMVDTGIITPLPHHNKKGTIIGFYSPFLSEIQTKIALDLGQIITKEKKALYMNLEAFSALELYLSGKTDQDLLNLLFFAKNEADKFEYRLESMLIHERDLAVLPPVTSFEELKDISVYEWKELFEKIQERTNYEVIILELSECLPSFFQMLKLCDQTVMLLHEGDVAKAKYHRFQKVIQLLEQEELIKKQKVIWLKDKSQAAISKITNDLKEELIQNA